MRFGWPRGLSAPAAYNRRPASPESHASTSSTTGRVLPHRRRAQRMGARHFRSHRRRLRSPRAHRGALDRLLVPQASPQGCGPEAGNERCGRRHGHGDRKSTRLNSSHSQTSYAVFCLKKKNNTEQIDVKLAYTIPTLINPRTMVYFSFSITRHALIAYSTNTNHARPAAIEEASCRVCS